MRAENCKRGSDVSLCLRQMMLLTSIVTHPGAAHRDDFLSVALALTHYGCVPVFRRDPTEAELEDSTVLVLDTGGRHEPERLNFDHHQLPRDAEPACAFSMLVQHLGLEEMFQLQSWYAMTALLDSKGPFAAAKALGLDALPEQLFSPIERTLLGMFGDCEEIMPTFGPNVDQGAEVNPLHLMISSLGGQLLQDVRDYAAAYARVQGLVRVVEVDDLKCFVVPEAITPVLGRVVSQYRDLAHPEVALSVTMSDRQGESWALYRYDDHPRVDFARLSGDQVVFAHPGGFIAKLAPGVDEDGALGFVRAALV